MMLPYIPDYPPCFDTNLVRPYWDAIQEGDLALPACSICGGWQWYPREFVTCHAEAHLIWKPVPHHGALFTFTRAHRSFLPGAAREIAPYISALVELDGMVGVRIPTLLVNVKDTAPYIGMPVRLCPQYGITHTVPAFEPIPVLEAEL